MKSVAHLSLRYYVRQKLDPSGIGLDVLFPVNLADAAKTKLLALSSASL